jgi:hypothetical protein
VLQVSDFENFSLQNTLNFATTHAGQPTSAKPKAKIEAAKGGVPGRIPTHCPVHFKLYHYPGFGLREPKTIMGEQ